MAWTIPTSRSSLYVVTSSVWNNELVGNLVEASTIYGYTPGWGSESNPQPVLGNGTLIGSYIKLGLLCTLRIVFVAGTTTTFGTGDWAFTLPLTADGSSGVFTVSIQDVGTMFYVGGARLVASTSLKIATHGASGFLSSSDSRPFAWSAANSDNFILTGQYLTASV